MSGSGTDSSGLSNAGGLLSNARLTTHPYGRTRAQRTSNSCEPGHRRHCSDHSGHPAVRPGPMLRRCRDARPPVLLRRRSRRRPSEGDLSDLHPECSVPRRGARTQRGVRRLGRRAADRRRAGPLRPSTWSAPDTSHRNGRRRGPDSGASGRLTRRRQAAPSFHLVRPHRGLPLLVLVRFAVGFRRQAGPEGRDEPERRQRVAIRVAPDNLGRPRGLRAPMGA